MAAFEHLPYNYVKHFMESQLDKFCANSEMIFDSYEELRLYAEVPVNLNRLVGEGRYYCYRSLGGLIEKGLHLKIYDLEEGGSLEAKSGIFAYSSNLHIDCDIFTFLRKTIDTLREKDSRITIRNDLNLF